ncbi:Citrinin polyketide synthase [Lachnellula suecica]|uniref:Citrinin polyketide synthase n=1 Tax=Lachnellula suecica TaxID=602035 RepID=A0A8T9CHD5_9HELO|nr:Citrinin polyketide synthase [Lachnellula suecica]
MANSTCNLNQKGLTLIFGPQDPDINAEFLRKLRSTLLETEGLEWIVEVMSKLPEHWQSISETLPELKVVSGRKLLEAFNEWIRKGTFPKEMFPLPNILITPDNLKQAFGVPVETAGLCTGLFSSAAVASSANIDELEVNGAAAIRMAVVIGAMVDAGESKCEWQSMAVSSPAAGNELARVLKDFPEAYISVLSEEKLVTVTAPKSGSAELFKKLREAGLIFAETALRGAFHCGNRSGDIKSLLHFFDSDPAFQFPNSSLLHFPTRSANGEEYSSEDKLHHTATHAMLTDQANWHQLFTSLQSSTSLHESLVVAFGRERCVPQWLVRKLGGRLMQGADVGSGKFQLPAQFSRLLTSTEDDAIAVIGMACNFPGGDDTDEFWNTLRIGKSQHKEVPTERLDFHTPAWRDYDQERKWFGNFVNDHDAFDHRFFKKSSREMSSTDPQQRLMLQVAYQAVEQSGYFNMSNVDPQIGCYVGIGVADYESNVACYPPNAYTATGTLKSFAAGKISHYFGWSGPGITIDTACSSSAVAVHQACRAILSGECSAALAGGTSIMASPEWYQNLDGASFLSPTGQCKPFDSNADGYCRGEGSGAVFLKKLSDAIKDGNQVLGVIQASSINQNENCSAITAPSVLSLSNVFNSVIRKAGLDPKNVSVVEAHGTGTQVGDKAEYESIRKVFGGPGRSDSISLGSVKGLVGHLECASGIAALVKTLLMIHNGAIPPQPSFQRISPKLNASPSDNIEISTKLKAWDSDFRVALLNNYGASGSNASLVVTQPPSNQPKKVTSDQRSTLKVPFWFSGLDEQSLRAYCTKLLALLRSNKGSDSRLTISNLSFQLSRQSNRSLNQALILSCNYVDELEEKLASFTGGRGGISSAARVVSPRPIVLCFGGQTSRFVGLDSEIFEQNKLLRTYLDKCNETCRSLGLASFYPAIFQKTPVEDIVQLQTMLFSIQYSSAKAWIDSGVRVASVVGHSFGELTAMCVSGVLSLNDALKVISERARIIQSKWGSDQGSMVALDGNQEDVERLLRETNSLSTSDNVTIACYNGPRSFTIAGSSNAVELLRKTLANNQAFSSLKAKQLDVTNAFHSTLVDPLLQDLETVGHDVIFRDPVIHHERATKDGTAPSTTGLFASHMRNPVYFGHAVQRLAQKHPSSVWLEAGSNSGITSMTSRALSSPKSSHFQAVNITGPGAVQNLADVTTSLWKEGVNAAFWAHHVDQTSEYSLILLPPYQFEKSKHWLARKVREQKVESVTPQLLDTPKGLWTFLGYQDATKTHGRFQINTASQEYLTYVSAHVIAQTAPICPSTFQHVIAMDAIGSLANSGDTKLHPELQGMEGSAPLCVDPSRLVWLDAKKTSADNSNWEWSITSTNIGGVKSDATLHVSGRIVFRSAKTAVYDFSKYERLVDQKRCLALLNGPDAEQVIQGSRNIYKAFAHIVQYNDEEYRGLQKIASQGNESAGRIIKQDDKKTVLSVGLADTFCQVAGIFLNCMTDCGDGDMYLSNRVDQWIRSPTVPQDSRPKFWDVYCRHHSPSEKEYVSDIFVFDSSSGDLVWVVLGLHFVKVPISGMARTLARLSPKSKGAKAALTPPPTPPEMPATKSTYPEFSSEPLEPARQQMPVKQKKVKKIKNPQRDISGGTRGLLCNLLGLEPEEVKPKSDLVELGIDSLLAMEVAREVENEFKVKLELEELIAMTDFQSLVNCLSSKLGISDDSAADEEEEEEEEEYENVGGVQTPAGSATSTQNGTWELVSDHSPSTTFSAEVIVDTFTDVKQLTDQCIEENQFGGYMDHVLPQQNELVVVHVVDAFEKMGCFLREAKAGQVLSRVKYLPKHEQVMEVFYDLLEKARIVDLNGSTISRTAIPVTSKSAETLLQELLRDSPEHGYDHKLTSLTGCKLAECLIGETDGIQLIFGTPEGKELVAGTYALSPMNTAWISLLERFWKQLLLQLPKQNEPINILELGAGTGGTTARLVPLLAASGIPFQYTVTDISPSLVAGLRKRFKHHPFMKFEILNIEKAPPAHFMNRHHVVLATNCVHATQSLAVTTKNIHHLLRPDGFLMMLEMSMPIPWVDSVFGLVEGWWLFNDGRKHALSQPPRWEKVLQANGYGHVDWSDGNLPENSVQHIIMALASGPSYDRVLMLPKPISNPTTDFAARQAVVDSFIEKYTGNFSAPICSPTSNRVVNAGKCVLVTGATGSLGSHLVSYFALQPSVGRVICLNRISSVDVATRQKEALESRGLILNREALSKLEFLETDTSKPMLGLSSTVYQRLAGSVDHIVHNAWAMSMTRPVRAFELQIKTMRNLIDLARECACRRSENDPSVGFQFVSSVSVMGCHPFVSGNALAPEERVTVESVLPMGYADAKLICERMLDKTLHRYPDTYRIMAVRIGQISGSKTNGYWNPVEHLAHLIKSSQTLNALPDLDGALSWCPVNDVAATLGELLLGNEAAYPIYHIENPVRQSWPEMLVVLAQALGIPEGNLLPYDEWIRRVREFPPSLAASENPAARLVEFFNTDFLRMACGGMVLDTAHSREHSGTLRNCEPISKELVLKYVKYWKEMGFLR